MLSDALLLQSALDANAFHFDLDLDLLAVYLGGSHRIHTTLSNTTAHELRGSCAYALFLLAHGGEAECARAQRILRRVLSVQDTDPESRTYGVWPYYWEEPLSQMNPPDWNWADFFGSKLLMIAHDYGHLLEPSLRESVHTAIGHAARSVERRNVSMHYTNIAVQGTFVVLSAAELFGWDDLWSSALDRLHRLLGTVDETGTLTEFNSPTYWWVTVMNLTRIRMYVQDATARALAERLHQRVWEHFLAHWHAPTRQLSGPMSRCYQTDLRGDVSVQMLLQKATQDRLHFYDAETLPRSVALGHIAVLDLQCPETLLPALLELKGTEEVRELVGLGTPPRVATTWRTPRVSLGSCNHQDLWNQRRNLLGYWRHAADPINAPGRFIHLRFLHDGYDFSSAFFNSVQSDGDVLGLVNFATPAGDKHVSLDQIQGGRFEARDLRLRLEVVDAASHLHNGSLQSRYSAGERLSLNLGGASLGWCVLDARFGGAASRGEISLEEETLCIDWVLYHTETATMLDWAEIAQAFVGFTLRLSPEPLEPVWPQEIWESRLGGVWFQAQWNRLALEAPTDIRTPSEARMAFKASLDGSEPPAPCLSESRLAP